MTSLDEGRIGDAYVAGHIDIEGDMLRPFELRASMKDFHLAVAAWRFIQPLLFGQVHTNRQAITAHYDIDPEFFLSFLDPKTPCYTQGMYESGRDARSRHPQEIRLVLRKMPSILPMSTSVTARIANRSRGLPFVGGSGSQKKTSGS